MVLSVTQKLINAKDVATMLGIKLSTVYAYADKGILTPIHLPSVRESKAKIRNKRFIRFSIEEVNNFINNLPGWPPSKKLGGGQ